MYADELSIKEKISAVATKIYGAADVKYDAAALKNIAEIEALDEKYSRFPICVAKTQYSLSDDASLLGRPEGFTLTVREVKLSAGAEFIVVLTGAIMTMPGLPKKPAAFSIDVDDDGNISGLF
jgi:formate--tetrahydrofolate ligase